MNPTKQFILIALISTFMTSSCKEDNTPIDDNPLPETHMEWKVTSGGATIDEFSGTTANGGLTIANFSITANDPADADPITTIYIKDPTPEIKEYVFTLPDNFLNYANLSFDPLDSYASVSGEFIVTSYEESYSASGVTFYVMDGTFEATCEDDDIPANVIEISGEFTDVLFADH